MDVTCANCGEPWDSHHLLYDEVGPTAVLRCAACAGILFYPSGVPMSELAVMKPKATPDRSRAGAAGEITPAARRAQALEALKAEGLTVGECIIALAVPDDDPYVRAARSLIDGSDDVRIGDHTVTAGAVIGDGAWVLSWLWISNDEVGLAATSDR